MLFVKRSLQRPRELKELGDAVRIASTIAKTLTAKKSASRPAPALRSLRNITRPTAPHFNSTDASDYVTTAFSRSLTRCPSKGGQLDFDCYARHTRRTAPSFSCLSALQPRNTPSARSWDIWMTICSQTMDYIVTSMVTILYVKRASIRKKGQRNSQRLYATGPSICAIIPTPVPRLATSFSTSILCWRSSIVRAASTSNSASGHSRSHPR